MKTTIAIFISATLCGCSTPAKDTKSIPGSEANVPRKYHQVVAGDTGAKIAMTHHLAIADLIAMNPDVDWTKLKIGMIIKIKK